MRNLTVAIILLMVLITLSCEKDNETHLTFEKIYGYAQKGPYLNGTSVTISELTDELISTGKNFSSQILDNTGTFEIKNIELTSQYVELKADGFYFDEVRNENSTAQLTLYALSDLKEKNNLNVNILSHLEKRRVDYLVASGSGFPDAKKQAQQEILSIFEINKEDIAESELLDIARTGDDNAMLLAVSIILQGYLSVSDLSEMLANISADIREDGILNDQSIGSTLINNARTIKTGDIRLNLENRYNELGLEVIIPEFEKYIKQFIDSTNFEYTGGIKYPETGKYGFNILYKERTGYTTGRYSMKASLPEGTDLKVKIRGQYHWYFNAFQDNTGWEVGDWDFSDNSRIFTSASTGEIDFEIYLERLQNDSLTTYPNKIYILVYENNSADTTWTKVISIN